MLPPQPQLSLPTAQNGTFHGLSRPFCRRKLAIGESAALVRYSTHCIISCTEPLPTLPQMHGSEATCSQKVLNSWVPKWLFSTTPPQVVLMMAGRLSCGPTPYH